MGGVGTIGSLGSVRGAAPAASASEAPQRPQEAAGCDSVAEGHRTLPLALNVRLRGFAQDGPGGSGCKAAVDLRSQAVTFLQKFLPVLLRD